MGVVVKLAVAARRARRLVRGPRENVTVNDQGRLLHITEKAESNVFWVDSRLRRLVHPDDMDVLQVLLETLLTAKPRDFGFRLVRADGEIRHVRGRIELVTDSERDSDILAVIQDDTDGWRREQGLGSMRCGWPARRSSEGSVAGAWTQADRRDPATPTLGYVARVNAAVLHFGAALDITELEEARQDLQSSEGRYRLLVENMTQGFVHHDRDGGIRTANPAAVQLLGLELVQRSAARPWARVARRGGGAPPDATSACAAPSLARCVCPQAARERHS